jgi:hypothetical protein
MFGEIHSTKLATLVVVKLLRKILQGFAQIHALPIEVSMQLSSIKQVHYIMYLIIVSLYHKNAVC